MNVHVVKISYISMLASMGRKVARNFELQIFCFYVISFRIFTSLHFYNWFHQARVYTTYSRQRYLKSFTLRYFIGEHRKCILKPFNCVISTMFFREHVDSNGNIFLCLWFRTSVIYINNCPTRRNTKQFIFYSASSLYIFRVSTTPITMSTQNCNYSLRYWSYFLCSYLPQKWSSLITLAGGSCTKKYDQYQRLYLQFCVLLMMGVVDTRNMQNELAE